MASELEELKKDYGVRAFYRADTLYVCWVTPVESTQKHYFTWRKNIIEDKTQGGETGDKKIQVKAISVSKKGKRIKTEVGDKGGEVRTVFAYDLTKSQLEDFAKNELSKMQTGTLAGSIMVFGSPAVHKLDRVQLKASSGDEGTYRVDKVTRTFGAGGYRQEITLGAMLSG